MRTIHRALWLLAALAFTGQVAGEGVDALVFHANPDESAAQAHWESPSGCQSHGDHCVLGFSGAGPRLLASAIPLSAGVNEWQALPPASQFILVRSHAPGPNQARAPPLTSR